MNRQPAPLSIKQRIRGFIAQRLSSRSFGDRDSFSKGGIIDSTGVLELVAFIESEFSISIGSEEMKPANLDSLASLETFIQRKTTV